MMNNNADIKAKIVAFEEQQMDQRAELGKLRSQLQPEEVDNFEFDTVSGAVALPELFSGRSDLILIHNMGAACSYCTMWADGLNGLLPHLESRAAVAFVSPDSPDTQQKIAKTRGWNFQMYSDPTGKFTDKMGFVRRENDGKREYWPGVSSFYKSEDKVFRVNSGQFGPWDMFCPTWHLFDLLRGGCGEWEPKDSYNTTDNTNLEEVRSTA